jgi:glycosyltransferase involved in cell wall biosynthesis
MSFFLVDAGREWRDSQRQVLDIARDLRKRGLTAHIVIDPDGDLARRASEESLSTIALRMHGRMRWLVRKSLARSMRSLSCRLVHFHEPLGAEIGLPAAATAQVPVRVLSRQADSSPLGGKLPLGSVDAIIADSDAVRTSLVRGGVPETVVEVVPQGRDFSRFTSQAADDLVRREIGLGPEDFLVGVVLPLEDERGHGAMLEAAAVVRGQAPKVRIVVLGEGPLRLEAGDSAEPGGPDASKIVRYRLGYRSDAPRILASLNMFAVFSHLEGYGRFLIEAMASGLPVAAADVGTARDIVTHRETGLLIPPRNGRALAEAIVKIHFDRNLASRLAAKGREAVLESYSVEAMARRIIGIYERRAHRKGVRLG